jgi:hypothetical protein
VPAGVTAEVTATPPAVRPSDALWLPPVTRSQPGASHLPGTDEDEVGGPSPPRPTQVRYTFPFTAQPSARPRASVMRHSVATTTR